MANEMAAYHKELQQADLDPASNSRTVTINKALKDLPCITDEESISLNEELTYSEIKQALKQSPNNKAPRLNGIPIEVYKTLHKRHIINSKADKPSFNIIKLLKTAYNDIENNGITEKNLLKGWLCPIYKKKDCCEISNYRPITILNVKYKILTTALMGKLSLIAPKLVNKCQAAFIKRRSIFDQIDLVTRMTDLCEITNQDGAIIALDQEKAYNKIRHDYLWIVIKAMNIPTCLINTIKSLYTKAETTVILNSETSRKFQVTRGVRQGDPLSCLLFNLAIEPMSHVLRTSDNLSGLHINTPNVQHKARVLALFTDDASIFLSKNDNPNSLFEILNNWCIASGAKFNKEKTVVIPVGSKEYRSNVHRTRS